MIREEENPKKTKDENAECEISLTPVREAQRYGIAELDPDWRKILGTVVKSVEPKSNSAVIEVIAFHTTFSEVGAKLKPF